MARRISAAAGLRSPGRYCLQMETFRGIDLNNAPGNVDLTRSPDAPNMIRGETGKVRKRQGYFYEAEQYGGRINGVHFWNQTRVVHAGTVLHWTDEDGTPRTYSGLADTRSQSRMLGGKLCILDTESLFIFDGGGPRPARDEAYIPTLMISRSPAGGGTVLEPLNLLGRKWREQFIANGTDKVFTLSVKDWAADPPVVETMDTAGNWAAVSGASYTYSASAGTVTFSSAPAAPAVPGTDNVRITAAKDRPGDIAKIDGCTVMEVYGVGGNPDRLFLSGHPDHPGEDYHSDLNDPTYFGDTWYANFGQDARAVTGYSVLGNLLLTHKDGKDGKGGVIIRSGTLADGAAAFPVVNTLTGETAIAPFSFASLGKEPFFLTRRGVFSLTAAELTGERYAQLRSFYIAPALMAEDRPEEAFAAVWQDFYLLALNEKIYILDGAQKTYQPSEPYSTHQCECYLWTDIPARVLWQEGDTLCFGTAEGKIGRFYQDTSNPASYSDDGKAIPAHWDTPDLTGTYFFRRKTFRNIAVRLQSAAVTGVTVRVQRHGLWHDLFTADKQFRYFDWNFIDLSKLVFSADRTPKTLNARIRVRAVDKARFRLQNHALNESFGLYSLALEYSE